MDHDWGAGNAAETERWLSGARMPDQRLPRPEDQEPLHGAWREVACALRNLCVAHPARIVREFGGRHTVRHVENVLATMKRVGLVQEDDGWKLTRRGAIRLAKGD